MSVYRSTKEEALNHYADHPETKHFMQYDGLHVGDQGDDIMRPDRDGDCLTGGDTWELMHGANVRLLIPCGETKATVLRLLRKIVGWIEGDERFDETSVELSRELAAFPCSAGPMPF